MRCVITAPAPSGRGGGEEPLRLRHHLSLRSEFAARHPALKRFDDRTVASHRARGTLAAAFVDSQLAHMRTNVSTEAAAKAAAAWLVENGPSVLRGIDPAIARAGEVRPAAVVSEETYARVMTQQAALVKAALAMGKASSSSDTFLPAYRDFRSEAERTALGVRVGVAPAAPIATVTGNAGKVAAKAGAGDSEEAEEGLAGSELSASGATAVVVEDGAGSGSGTAAAGGQLR